MCKREASYLALCAALLTGCAATPFTHRPQQDIPEGPGLFSGRQGGVVLYSDRKAEDPTLAPERDRRSGTDSSADASLQDEYRQYRDFQEFQRWKNTDRDTPDYREFREWQEWKAYRAWQRSAK